MDFAKKFAEKVKNKTEALAQAQLHLLDKIKVSPEIQKARYDICLGCEKLYKPTSTCRLCGCFMQLKTWMPEQSCPIDKWSKVSTMEKIENEREGQ